MKGLTERQREILGWIVAYIQINWRPPTFQEVAAHFGITPPAVSSIAEALQKKGYLAKGDGTARSLTPINLNEASVGCIDKDLFTLVPSSDSVAVVTGFDGTIRVSSRHGGSRPLFAVMVKGDSMIEYQIFDGDMVVVRKQDFAEDGDVVLASVGLELMVRRFFTGDDETVMLMAENKNINSISVHWEELRIYGKVVAVYRDIE